MKKLVQRFALMALMLLPMLTYGQVSVAVNYTLRGSYTVTVDGEYEVVDATPSSANYIVTDESWTWISDGSVITPDGSDIIKVDVDTWKFKSDVARSIRIKFFPKMCTLTLNAVNGTITDVDDNTLAAQYAYGTHLTVKATPANTHYAFSQWSDGVNVSTNNPYSFYITDDTELTATFDAANYTVTIQTDPAAAMDEMTFTVNGSAYDPSAEYAYMTDVTIVASDGTHYFANASAEFEIGGSTVGTGASYTISAIGENTTVIYHPVASTFSLTVQSDDDLAGSVTGSDPDVPYNTTVSIEAIPSDGFDFLRWNDANTDNPRSVTVTEDVVYTAFFQYQEHTLAFSCEVNGEVVPGAATFTVGDTTPAAKYPHLTALNVKAVPTNNYNFGYWKDNNVTTKTRSLYLTDDTTLVAVLTPRNYDVDYVVNDKLDITLTPAGPYYYGESVTIEATPKTLYEHEYEFKEWQKGGVLFSTDNPCTFTVESAMMLTAVYQGVEYTVNVATSLGDDSEGTAESDVATVRFGESFTLTATPAAGHVFKSWEPGGIVVTPYTVTSFASNATHELNYTASFGPEQYVVTVEAPDAHFGITIPSAGNNSADFGTAFAAPAYTNADASKYELTGWKDNHDNALTMPFTVAGDTTVIAVIDSVEYDLTLTNATIAGNVTSVKYNTHFTLTPADIAGKTFKNWKVNGVDGDTDPAFEFVMTNADMEIEAVYQDEVFYVHADANIIGAGTITGTGDDFTYGATTSLEATANAHYTFTKWSDDVTVNPRTVTVVSDTTFTAVFTPETYTITVQVNDPVMGSAATSEDEAEYNDYIYTYLTATPNPMGGYYLKCWLDQNGDTINASYQIAMDVVATAVFGYSDMTVTTYAAEYGDTASHQDTWGSIATTGVLAYTGEVTVTATANTHYNFMGWSDGVNDNPRTFILTRDTIFYAFFAPDTHTVTLTVNDENMGEITGFTGTKAAYGSVINVTAEPATAEHYHFVKWSDNTTDPIHAAITVEGDITLEAIFGIDSVTITAANTDGFGTFTPAAAVEVGYGSTVTLSATANHGYKFQKWSNGITDITTNPYELTATADETWTVSFELDQFTVTAIATPAHAAATITGAGDYDYLTDVDVTATAATGYVLTGYEDEDGNAVVMPISLTDDTTVYAVFDSVTVAITAVSNNNVWGTVSPASASAKYNTTFHLTATPEPGYELVSWNDGTTTYPAASLDTNFTVPATDVTYTANFAAGEFEVAGVVAATCTEMGTVTGTASALYGETVTLTATANAGYHFVNWDNDALLTDAAHAFAVGTENTTHTAYFEPDTYTLTIAVNEPVRGHVENAGATVTTMPVDFGATVDLTAVSHTGYELDKWVTIHGNDSTDATISFVYNIAANATVTANFKYRMWEVTVNGTNNATVDGDGTYANGAEATLTATPAEHYTEWKGWRNEADEIVSTDNPLTVTVLSDTTLTAVFDVDTHDVAFTILPDDTYGTITNGTDGRYAYGTQIALTAVPTDPLHYSFVEWEDGSNVAERTVTVEGDTTFTATFEADKYQFTVSSDNTTMGNVTGTASGLYDYNTSISVNVTEETGYHFVKWVDANGDSITNVLPYTFNIDRDSTIKAVFTNDLYTLRLETPVREMGWLAIDGDSAGYVANGYIERQVPSHTDIAITAMPNYGYNFGAWSDDATADSVRTIQVDADLTLTATFGYMTYDITLAANDDARGTVVFNGTYNNNYGAKDTIQANPNPGFQFLYWAEDNATPNPRPIIVSENATYTAVFGYLPQNIVSDECDSVVWMNGTELVGTYYNDEVATETFTDIYGLDSVVTNNITVRHSTTGIDVQTSCYTTFTWIDGVDYTESNNEATFTLTNLAGCDSVVTLNFTYFQNSSVDTTVEACNPFTWAYTGLTYDTEGDHVTAAVADMNGCDSTTALHLTFTTPKDTNYTVTACDEFTWTIAGVDHVYTATGDDSFVFTDVNQCTATATIHVTINNSTTGTDVKDVCDTYTWIDGNTYTENNNTATFTLPNAVGCDSVVTLDLTVRHSTAYTDVQVACDTYTWINGIDYVASNNADTYTTTNAAGCDSVITLDLTVNYSNTGIDVQDECDSYTWIDGMTYTETNPAAAEFTIANGNAVGCDSTVTLNLTIRNKVTVVQNAEACDTYEWNGLTFTESGNVTINSNGGAANGCDSVTTLQLTIQHTIDSTLEAVAVCDQYEWIFNGTTVDTYTTSGDKVYEFVEGLCEHNTATLPLTINALADVEETAMACETYTWNIASTSESFTYTEGGDKVETITDANGCTATATLHLTINSNPEIEQTAEACSSYDWTVSGQTFHYTASGDYVETITDGNCTGTATLHLTIHTPETGVNTVAAICDGAVYTWNNTDYTVAGEYYNTYTDANNCTVEDTLTLTVNVPAVGQNVAAAICEGETYTWNNTDYTVAGEYYNAYTDAYNCAVEDTLTLTVNAPAASQNVTEAICEGAAYAWNNTDYTVAGEYYHAYTDANNCAVVDTLTLTVNTPAASQNVAEAICDGESYTWNNTDYTVAGEYYHAYTDANNCDVVDTLTLTVNTPAAGTNTAEAICDGDTYTWNNLPYTAAGTYTQSTVDANGCTVVNTLVLTVYTPAAGTTTTEAICDGDTYTWNNQSYTAAGTYTANTTDANGCTVVNTLVLTVNQPQNTTETETACDTYTWNGTAYTASGVYTNAITDANGCAATATLNLTVNQSVTNAIALSDTASVVFDNVTYTTDTVVTVTYTAANGCDSVVTATITVVPEVQPQTDSVMITVTAALPIHGTVTPSGYGFYYLGDVINATATPDSGYQFNYWHIGYITDNGIVNDTVYDNPLVFNVDSNALTYSVITFIAEFSSISGIEDSMTLVVAVNDSTMGTTVPAPGTYRVAIGDSISLVAEANEGYHLDHWTLIVNNSEYQETDDTIVVYSMVVSTEDIHYLTAYFVADSTPFDTNNYYYVNVLSADTLMGIVGEGDSVAEGSRFTAYAIANDGYRFVNWTDQSGDTISTENPYIFTVIQDVTLIANFEVDSTPVIDTVYYTITVNYDATMGTVTGEGRYVAGTIVTLVATANDGYRFRGWVNGTDTVTSTREYTFTLNSDVILTAAFEALPVSYMVIGESNDTTMGTVLGSGEYAEGSVATLTAQAKSGYHFVHWSNGETTPSITFIVTEDVTVIAYFEVDDTPQGIDESEIDNVTIYSAESRIIVSGAEGKTVNVFDINGRTVSTMSVAAETVEFRMAATGVYLVKVGNAPAKRVLVVR